MLLPVVLVACQSMSPSGDVFSPVVLNAPSAGPAAPTLDTRFDLEAEPFTITSDELAKNATDTSGAASPGSEPEASFVPEAVLAPTPMGLPPISQFPVRLLSTIPQAQPPRAILGLPSGQEVVVAPGSLLAPEGLVVMSISAGRVQLAKIHAAGDHAQIESIEITAQYP